MTKAFKQAQNGVWGKNEFMKKQRAKKTNKLKNEIKSSYCDGLKKKCKTYFYNYLYYY